MRSSDFAFGNYRENLNIREIKSMKKLINDSLLLFTIPLSLIIISAQTEQKAELVVQTGHANIVGAIAFSSDGKFIVTGDSYSPTIIL